MASKRKKPGIRADQWLNSHEKAILRHGKMILAAEIQRRTGCRAGEVLSITYNDIIRGEYIFIRGLKRSYDRYFHCPDIIQHLVNQAASKPSDRVFPFDYRQYYAWFKRYIGGIPGAGKKNRRVTHRFRQEVIQLLHRTQEEKDPGVSNFIGHKSRSTLKYYLQRKKK